MTKAQIKWAQQHDWFIRVDDVMGHQLVVARDFAANDATGQYEAQEVRFHDFKELAHWAGY